MFGQASLSEIPGDTVGANFATAPRQTGGSVHFILALDVNGWPTCE